MPSLADLQTLSAQIQGKDVENDSFAAAFQQALSKSAIAFRGKMLAFRRSHIDGRAGIQIEEALSSPLKSYLSQKLKIIIPNTCQVYPKIILSEAEHELNGHVIANQTYFWTEVRLANGLVYCFDNNHPNGLIRDKFFTALTFVMELFLPDLEPDPAPGSLLSKRDLTQRTAFGDPAHHYKTHIQTLGANHLLMLDATVQVYREELQLRINWQYYVKNLAQRFNCNVLDLKRLSVLTRPADADEQGQEKREFRSSSAHAKHAFQSLKDSLNSIKTGPRPAPAAEKSITFFDELGD